MDCWDKDWLRTGDWEGRRADLRCWREAGRVGRCSWGLLSPRSSKLRFSAHQQHLLCTSAHSAKGDGTCSSSPPARSFLLSLPASLSSLDVLSHTGSKRVYVIPRDLARRILPPLSASVISVTEAGPLLSLPFNFWLLGLVSLPSTPNQNPLDNAVRHLVPRPLLPRSSDCGSAAD